ncbi:MAG: hypothetical protein HY711_08090 [Candidatus Melainabacteria bacterium]|nr:hypothetical protein [Candidatus Melainabacteria bacterium]
MGHLPSWLTSLSSNAVILASTGTVLIVLIGLLIFWRYRHILKHRPDSYFIRWLSKEQKSRLSQASVPFTTTAVEPGEEGVLLSCRNLKRALKVLKAQIVETFVLHDKQIHEIVLTVSLPKIPPLRQYTVTVKSELAGWYYRWYCGRKIARVVRDVLLPSIKTNIVVHLDPRSTCVPNIDENFHVLLYSSLKQDSSVHPPGKLFGVPVLFKSQAYLPSLQGIPIIDGATNFAVAELVDNCLYLHLDMLGDIANNSPQLGLLARVLERVDEELIADRVLADILKATNIQNNSVDTDKSHAVEVAGFSGRRETVIASLVRDILLPAVKSNIIVKNCQGHNETPVSDGAFRVFFFSSPIGSPYLETPESLWGHRLLKRGLAFVPSAMGLPIIDDAGFIVGELVDGNLYLHQEYIHCGSKAEAALLARLLVEVRHELSEAASATSESLTKLIANHFDNECLRQANACAAHPVSLSVPELTKQRISLRKLVKDTHLAELHLVRFQAAPQEELGREFDELLKLANVTDVKMTNDALVVSTRTLYCVHPKTKQKHEIGAFEIHIYMGRNAIKWFNKTRRVHGGRNNMNAPHVDENGNACFGNTKDLFPMLISRREFVSAVELAIAFIESVNLDDNWGKFLGHWPIAA